MNETTTDPSSADETAAEQAHEATDAPAAEAAETAAPAATARTAARPRRAVGGAGIRWRPTRCAPAGGMTTGVAATS